MASSTTGSIDDRIRFSRTLRNADLLPFCHHDATVRKELGRLATFADIDSSFRGSAVWLAGSGCIYNAEEGYTECIYGGKITPISNATECGSMRLCDLVSFHHATCIKYQLYIKKKQRELAMNYAQRNILRHLKRFRRNDTEIRRDDEDPCRLVTLDVLLDMGYEEKSIIKSTVKHFLENGEFPDVQAMLDKMEQDE